MKILPDAATSGKRCFETKQQGSAILIEIHEDFETSGPRMSDFKRLEART